MVQGDKEYKRAPVNETVLFLVNFLKISSTKIGATAPEIIEINFTLKGLRPRIEMGKIDR